MILNENMDLKVKYTDKLSISFKSEKYKFEDGDLEKINNLSLKPMKTEEITVYTALLIDDQVTRNNTQYPRDFQKMLLSLPVGEGNFIGAPVLFGDGEDHQEVASAQVGRIFDAWQVTNETGNVGVMAKMYIINEGHEALINKVDTGILKELSIAASVEMPLCSLCRQDIRTCEHQLGKDGCFAVMSGNGFCGEVSFVAVPGSDQAKILKPEEMNNYARLQESIKEKCKMSLADIKGYVSQLKDLMKKEGSHLIKPEDAKAMEEMEKKRKEDESKKIEIIESLASKIETEYLNQVEITNKMTVKEKEISTSLEVTKAKEKALDDEKNAYTHKIEERANEIIREKLIDETVRMGTLIDKIEIKDKEASRKFFRNLNTEEISRIKDIFFKEGLVIFKTQRAPDAPKDDIPKEKDVRTIARMVLNREPKES